MKAKESQPAERSGREQKMGHFFTSRRQMAPGSSKGGFKSGKVDRQVQDLAGKSHIS